MRDMTKEALQQAFSGESQAQLKYLIYAEKAEAEGKINIARLFRAVAHAEYVHAKNHFKALEKLHTTAENLDDARGGEEFEVEEMYPAYDAIATLQDEKKAKTAIYYALEAEKIHRNMYEEAKDLVIAGKDMDGKRIYICPICGFTHIGEDDLPGNCPVCNVPNEKFRIF
ncbi:rubrerythrin family protein [bacterium]|nr:rubrerythrin family protein [bacterium]